MNNKKNSSFKIETLIIILIAGCMIFLVDFTNNKINEFSRLEEEIMLVNHDPSNPIHEQLAQEIIEYRPDTYKMIEIYTEDFDIMMTLQFIETGLKNINLDEYPDLIELFNEHEEGHTQLSFSDNEVKEDIYFKWVKASDNNKYLMIVYSSRHPVQNIWIFNFVCYIVLLLIFILLLRMHLKNYKDKVQQYEQLSNDLKKRLRH